MKKIKISTATKKYFYYTGSGILSKLPDVLHKHNSSRKLFFVIDANVIKHHREKLEAVSNAIERETYTYHFPSGERAKNNNQLNKIYKFLLDNGADRHSTIIAAGGGVTGDIAGYAASTFMRGINLIHIPTTLLAMVDSSIGGKTGINFSSKKNMIGTFYQPEMVLADHDFLNSLPYPEIKSGLGEIIKYAFLLNEELFDFVSGNIDKLLLLDKKIIRHAVIECAAIKAAVVRQDEKETGLRKILNLGHTFAHAYESELNFKIKHGEAVTAGIVSAVFLSHKLKITSVKTHQKFLRLLEKIKLPDNFFMINKENIFSIMQHDKKNKNGRIKFILPKKIGETLIDIEAGKQDIFYSIDAASRFISKI